MSREVRRVPLDFDWPANKVWWGYVVSVHLPDCPWCEGGWSPAAIRHRTEFYRRISAAQSMFAGEREWHEVAAEELGEESLTCSRCNGEGTMAPPSLREAAEQFREAWHQEPPAGDGWQMWETVSEGSPVSPVFATPEELVDWMTQPGDGDWRRPYSREAAEAFVKVGYSIGSFGMIGGRMVDGVEMLVEPK